MMLIERIYTIMERRKWLAPSALCILTALLLIPALSLSFNENIMDFMPLDAGTRQGMDIYQRISGSDKIIILADGETRNSSAAAIDSFASDLTGVIPDAQVMTGADIVAVQEMIDNVYAVAPALLTDSDFCHVQRILETPDSVKTRLADLRERLLLPGATVSAQDPLGLFSPLLRRATAMSPQMDMDIEDGYIFLNDTTTALAIVTSPYEPHETAANARLMQVLDSLADVSSANISAVGTIPVSVSNATQIKKDTILSVSISVAMIAILLIGTFVRKRNLLLIPLTIAFGVVFAFGIIGLIREEISLIVMGISAVIIGIAVNYPLHFITHADDGHSPRQVLKDISKPLIIGNITTVGSFLCLVPLKSVALQDLGLFAALLLVGSIIFVVLFLPHFVSYPSNKKATPRGRVILDKISSVATSPGRSIVLVIVLVSLVLGWFSTKTSFDTDLRHINYMTDEQRYSVSRLLESNNGMSAEYLAISQKTSLDSALECHEQLPIISDVEYSRITDIFPSKNTINKRIQRWNEMVAKNGAQIAHRFSSIADSLGFSATAFSEFTNSLVNGISAPTSADFDAIKKLLADRYIIADSTSYIVVSRLNIPRNRENDVKEIFSNSDVSLFNINEANARISVAMTDEFNFIAFACAFIVFAFLWISFGRLELATIAFVPMALSWVWILGLMAIFGIQFNIVNIILATFIFGQGDDYTIFITEGVVNEYKTGRRMLASFKTGILISALIMFFGIGSLAFAVHPALQSLAWVTILGMLVVVFMAYILPPILFKFIIRYKRFIPYNNYYNK